MKSVHLFDCWSLNNVVAEKKLSKNTVNIRIILGVTVKELEKYACIASTICIIVK